MNVTTPCQSTGEHPAHPHTSHVYECGGVRRRHPTSRACVCAGCTHTLVCPLAWLTLVHHHAPPTRPPARTCYTLAPSPTHTHPPPPARPCTPAGLWYLQPTPLATRFMRTLTQRLMWERPWQWEQTAW